MQSLSTMWSRPVQQAGGRTIAKAGSLERLATLSKQSLRSDVDGAEVVRRGYIMACVALVTLLLTCVLTSLDPSLNLFKHLTKFVDSTSDASWNAKWNALEGSTSDASWNAKWSALEGSTSDASWNALEGATPPRAGCDANSAKLKVFMYDLPPEFHYGMIAEYKAEGNQIWPTNISDIPKYPGGLYQQHSPEYWLITDVLTSDMADRTSPCTAFRVRRWQDADVVLVPFFASLSYNRYSRPVAAGKSTHQSDQNQELQEKLLRFLSSQPAWAASHGADHVVIIHHPNSMVHSRDRFRNSMFVVADFGRYVTNVANMRKDVVAPYKHVIPSFDDDTTGAKSFPLRPTLLFFQGAIVRKEGGIIRRELWELLRDEPDVVFATGATTSEGIRTATAGMRSSKFCLHLAGDTPSSNRLFDAVMSHCVPLIISDEIELPFEDVMDYTQFCLFVTSKQALRKGFVTELLRNFSVTEWARMHARMVEVQRHFEYQHPTEVGDAVHMTWDAIARKVPALTLARNKNRRYARSSNSKSSNPKL